MKTFSFSFGCLKTACGFEFLLVSTELHAHPSRRRFVWGNRDKADQGLLICYLLKLISSQSH